MAAAVASQSVRERFAAKTVAVPGSACLWWMGAVSGRGHGRFWSGERLVVISHRFAFAVHHGLDGLRVAPLFGHRCDNPLCQRIGPGHVEVSNAVTNGREWVSRRYRHDSPLADPRGARGPAEVLRALACSDPRGVRDEIERGRVVTRSQPTGRFATLSQAQKAARTKVLLDKQAGLKTDRWIVELADNVDASLTSAAMGQGWSPS